MKEQKVMIRGKKGQQKNAYITTPTKKKKLGAKFGKKFEWVRKASLAPRTAFVLSLIHI